MTKACAERMGTCREYGRKGRHVWERVMTKASAERMKSWREELGVHMGESESGRMRRSVDRE